MIAAHNFMFGRTNKFAQDMVAYYKFDGNTIDTLGLSPTGASVTPPIYQNANIGLGFEIPNNLNDRGIIYNNNSNFNFSDGLGNDLPFSISIWTRPTAYNTIGNFLVSKREAGSVQQYQLAYSTSNDNINFRKYSDTSNTNQQGIASPSGLFTLNNWHHIVITDNGTKTNAGMKLYLNGVQLTTTNLNAGTYTGMPVTSSRFFIGIFVGNLSTQNIGLTSETAIWKRELTLAEIQELYARGNNNQTIY